MEDLHLKLATVARHFEEGTEAGVTGALAELLLFPELSTFGSGDGQVRRRQERIASQLLDHLPASEAARRQHPEALEVENLVLEVAAPEGEPAWREKLELEVPFVRWTEDGGDTVAYVPLLGIEVVTPDPEELDELLRSHCKGALVRAGAAKSLLELAKIARPSRLEVDSKPVHLTPMSPKERHEIETGEGGRKKSVLAQVGSRMEKEVRDRPLSFGNEADLERLAGLLSGRRAGSALVVGKPGVGKTSLVWRMVRERERLGFERRPFWRTSGARIVAGQCGFGMWQERCNEIVNEAKDSSAILYLGNLCELMEVGQSTAGRESIADYLRPHLQRRDILAVLECTPDQLSAVERDNPRMLDALRQLTLEEPVPDAAFDILTRAAEVRAFKARGVAGFTVAALRRIDALHRRYGSYSAFPGRPLRFVENLLASHADGARDADLQIDDRAVDLAFAAETGMPSVLVDESETLDLVGVRRWFEDRVMGQPEAVGLGVDAIAAIKARLARPGQPLASFLFVGPTGVGKTELAKSLSEFFYGSRGRLTRLDMSEYSLPGSAGRLVSCGAADGEGLLTAQMREQPFSVLLLDEFEKAHPDVFDLFLQVLGEARLTDAAGRVADFSNAVVVLTSNLGAEGFAGGKLGFQSGEVVADTARDHFTTEAKKTFRPEFFNRIDRIVPFSPLDRETVDGVILREVADAGSRDGLAARQVALEVSDGVLDALGGSGFDPRYGARPARRAVERELLLPVADLLNRSAGRQSGTVRVEALGDKKAMRFEPDGDAKADARGELRREVDRLGAVRRLYSRLADSPLARAVASEYARLSLAASNTILHGQPATDDTMRRLALIAEIDEQIGRETALVASGEEAALLAWYEIDDPSATDTGHSERPPPTESQFEAALVRCFAAAEGEQERITLVLTGDDDKSWLVELVQVYAAICERAGFEVHGFRWDKKPVKDLLNKDGDAARPSELAPEELGRLHGDDGLAAVALAIRGETATALFGSEIGLHKHTAGEAEESICGVAAHEISPHELFIPLRDLRQPDLRTAPMRRQFDVGRGAYRDADEGRWVRAGFSVDVIERIMGQSLLRRAKVAMKA